MLKSVQFVSVETTLFLYANVLVLWADILDFNFYFFVNKKFLSYAFCVKDLRSEFFRIFTKIFEYILNRYTAFQTHVNTRQLPRQIRAYIEKKHYHVGKKVADVSFIWHPDTLFQPNDISAEIYR